MREMITQFRDTRPLTTKDLAVEEVPDAEETAQIGQPRMYPRSQKIAYRAS
jgi:hypothetical protein